MKRIHVLTLLASIAVAGCGGKSKPSTGGGGGSGTDDGSGSGTGSGIDTTEPDAGVAEAPAPDAEPPPDPHVALMEAEMAAYEAAKPVFAKSCGGCHIQGGAKATAKKLKHVDMTTYPFAGHHVDTITTTIGHVLGIDGAKPTMPADKPGSVKGDDLALVEAWIEAYNAADEGGAHAEGAGHDH
ncbi:MAG: hypothetical protein KA297_00335 [Kofleriaceae bacterium]|jgi:hypothetical protein|nr:hypothetical protein [Kofleriaceae bacterium]